MGACPLHASCKVALDWATADSAGFAVADIG